MPGFICDECGRVLANAKSLKAHKQIHTGGKPFQCEVCDKFFSRSGQLTEHMRIHTGEEPYLCQECSKVFRTQGTLSRHMRVHSGARPYECLPCGVSFALSRNLTRHNQRVHNENGDFLCQICHCRFSQQYYFSRHCEEKHPSESTTQSVTVHTHMEPEGMVTVTTQTSISSNNTTTISTVRSPMGSAYVVTECSSSATTRTAIQGSGLVTTNTGQNFPDFGSESIFSDASITEPLSTYNKALTEASAQFSLHEILDIEKSDIDTKGLYLDKKITTTNPIISIKISESIKAEEKRCIVTERGCEKLISLKYMPFEIGTTRFEYIVGNVRDTKIASLLKDTPSESFICFNLETPKENYNYIPSIPWQKRFIDIINKGMLELSTNNTIPTCTEFAYFMETGKINFSEPSPMEAKLTTQDTFLKEHIVFALFTNQNTTPVHMFIHLGNNICLGKIGSSGIYFQSIADIKSLYEEQFSKPLKLAKIRYKHVVDS